MAFWKKRKREPEPDVIRFENLQKLSAAAQELEQEYAGDSEAVAFLQDVHVWAVRKMIDELE